MGQPRHSTRKRPHSKEIGEGRSKCQYIAPTCSDTAILIAFFNPAKFKRILQNLLYILDCLRSNNYPVFVIECVFPGASPQVPGATVVRSNSIMFYKEQLLNLLEKSVPERYSKLVCLDGDILFDAPNWLDQVSSALDSVDILQPFHSAGYLIPDNTVTSGFLKPSFAYGFSKGGGKSMKALGTYHPGFAWAFKRNTFRAIGGLYPDAILGGGDLHFILNFYKGEFPPSYIKKYLGTRLTLEHWNTYHERFQRVAPSLGYLNLRVFHLFHGLIRNRQYTSRYPTIAPKLQDKWDDTIHINTDGLYEFRDPRINRYVLTYFKTRKEDVPLAVALRATRAEARTRRPVQNWNSALCSTVDTR